MGYFVIICELLFDLIRVINVFNVICVDFYKYINLIVCIFNFCCLDMYFFDFLWEFR